MKNRIRKLTMLAIATTIICTQSNAQNVAETPPLPKVRVSLEYGYTLRMAEVDPDASDALQDYLTKLTRGTNIGADASYFFKDKWGVGFLYSRFSASSSTSEKRNASGNLVLLAMEDNIAFSLYGIGLYEREAVLNGKAYLIGKIGVGWLTYLDNAELDGMKMKIEGKAIGFPLAFGAEYKLPYNLALGADLGYLIGTIRNFTVNGQSTSLIDNESANRFDLNVGLKYYWK